MLIEPFRNHIDQLNKLKIRENESLGVTHRYDIDIIL